LENKKSQGTLAIISGSVFGQRSKDMNNALIPPVVCTIVVTYNGAAWIRDCLRSLTESTYPTNVIIVDNASRDETVEIVGRNQRITCLRQSKNLGFGSANNIGIRVALQRGADFIFLLNQDARVHPEAIGQLVACAEDNKGFGILSPLHLSADGTHIDARFAAYVAKGASKFFSDLQSGRSEHLYALRSVNAAAWLLSRECLHRVGGFDPVFFLCGEDIDYCDRAAFHGFEIGFVPSAVIFHLRQTARPSGEWLRIRRRSDRKMGPMLLALKSPCRSVFRRLSDVSIYIIRDGMRSVLHLDLEAAATLVLTVIRTSLRLPLVWKHRRISLTSGPHWIQGPSTVPIDSSSNG
jgi:GT2 family glycosyltransferase